jgi:hypothetical protein
LGDPNSQNHLDPLRALLRVGYAAVKREELFDARDFQRLMDSLIDAHQPQLPAIPLPRNVGADERSNPRRIRERHGSEIQNEYGRAIGPDLRLEAKNVRQGQRPGKAKDRDSVTRALKLFGLKRLVSHGEMVTVVSWSEMLKTHEFGELALSPGLSPQISDCRSVLKAKGFGWLFAANGQTIDANGR